MKKLLLLSLVPLFVLVFPTQHAEAQSRKFNLEAKVIYEIHTTGNQFFVIVKLTDVITASTDVKTKCLLRTDNSMIIFYFDARTGVWVSHVLAAYLNKKAIYVEIGFNSNNTCYLRSLSTR